MRKVMIVDDESLVRVGFQTIIDWEAHGYQISGAYKNGLEAWEAIQLEGPPDVLLTDIKMPEMDGLELIEKIREQNIDCNILILSSHDEFNYLRASIKLKVQDYILKHIFEPDELIKTLNKLDYSTMKEEPQSELVNIEKEQQLLLQESMTESYSLTKQAKLDISRYPGMVEKWGLKNARGYWMSIRAYPRKTPYLNSELKALQYQLKDLMSRFSAIVFIGINQHIIHVFYKMESKSANLDENILNQWSNSILQKLDIPIVIGISEKGSLSDEIVSMRMQAETAMNKSFYLDEGVYVCEKSDPIDRISVVEWKELKETAVELIASNEVRNIINWIENVGNRFAARFIHQREAIRFLQMVYKCYLESRMGGLMVGKSNQEDELHSSLITFENAIENSVTNWKELLKITRDIMDTNEKLFLNRMTRPWLEVVLQYIDEHYTEQIRLEDVARLANFNENYFSQLFRDEMGVTFLSYITQLRIDKAIQLLKDPTISTEEVSFQVGYPNGNYFVKVFKKVTGITVSQYRANPNFLAKQINE